MADSTSSSFSNTLELKAHLIKEAKSHEVAIAELSSLSSSGAVYQKNANTFFRTTIPKATASEQKHLDLTKRKLENLNVS